jgi:Ca2+-binding EF-hand superfamily protein
MMRLDKFKMKRMKQIWDENEEGLDLHQFVKLMYNEIHCAEEEKLELLYGSINMFSDVDINGDGNMSWNEFV